VFKDDVFFFLKKKKDIFLMGNVMCMGEASREVRMHGGACSEEVNVRLTKIRKFFFFFFFFFWFF
jgi:hypothetical protein